MVEPEPREDRYHGPVAMLIGPSTLSAAMMTADAAKAFGIATLIGQPTSSPPNYFGETYAARMSSSGLLATYSTAHFVRANGDPEDPSLVEPHIRVDGPTTPSSDPVLEHARAWVVGANEVVQR